MRLFLFVILLAGLTLSEEAKFADYLYKQGDFSNAALEYERLLYKSDSLSHDNGQQALNRYRLGICTMQLGRLEEAENHFKLVFSDTALADSAHLASAHCMLRLGRLAEADSQAALLAHGNGPLIRGFLRLTEGKWEPAARFFDTAAVDSQVRIRAMALRALNDSLRYFKDKSHIVAGALALFPGGGHIYAGRKGDAFFSTSVIGMFGGIAAYYFWHDSNGRGIAFASITGAFYVGSIYGALVAVSHYNRDGRARLQARAERIIGE